MKAAPEAGRGPSHPPRAVPETAEEAARLLADASAAGTRVRLRGGGTGQGIGYPFQPDLTVSAAGLRRIAAWEPEDLTVAVEAGMPIRELEETLAERGQTAVLTERPGEGTVGGALASGRSGWRRFRYGPLRDRALEVTLATGDGRLVTAGGRLVKNVTGYDLPRLAVGSLGSLGMIVRVCLKLWPLPPARATVRVSSAEEALAKSYRPLAVLETERGTSVFLSGTPEEVEGQSAALGGDSSAGWDWPDPPAGPVRFSVRTPPSRLRAVAARLRSAGLSYVAQFGVGEATAAGEADPDFLNGLRSRAEADGGSLALWDAPAAVREEVDPWGTPPASLPIQRKLVSLFDPERVINPGILPGRL